MNLSPQSAALLPITLKMLQSLITALEKIVNSSYDKKLLKAMFVIMYFCCLRIGEVALSNHDDHVIQISQVSFSQVDSVFHSFTIQFNSFKMSGSRTPAITILRREHETICPVQLLLDYLAVRPRCSGPLFLSASNKLITRWWLLKMLRFCLSYLGWDNLAVNTHSFRIGRATDMFAQNYSDSYIQHVGRWASDAFKRYLRPQKVFA